MSQSGASTSGIAATENVNTVGLGYGIAIAVGILVLVSTIMLASYVCVRVYGRRGEARVRGVGGIDPVVEINGASEASDARGLSLSNRREEENGTAIFSGHGGEWTIGGLDDATVDSYPKFSYAKKKLYQGDEDDGDNSCSICLAEYCDGELIRMLPDCRHSFHASCVDAWLKMQASCPMCRTSPLPTPVATPLSELIPLARRPLESHYR